MKINYQTFGKRGSPVVFLHGWQQNSNSLLPFVPFFYKNHKLYFLDLPGFGDSDFSSGITTTNDYSKIIHSWMKKMKLDKVVLVGHSFGGRIASHMASLHPEDVLRLVVISPSGVNHDKWWYPWVGKIPKRLKSIFRPLTVRMEDKDVRQAGKLRLMIKNILKEDFEPVFKRINVPTLIIWGKDDCELPSSDGYKIKRLIEKSTLKIIPGSHFPFVDNPKLVAGLINSFIR